MAAGFSHISCQEAPALGAPQISLPAPSSAAIMNGAVNGCHIKVPQRTATRLSRRANAALIATSV